MLYLAAGPLVAIVGIVAVFFVLRRKSVEKRSMYSARRSQIEHKVRAARQRTLAPHGHVEKPPEPGPAAPSSFDFPPASPEPYQVPPSEPFRPAPEPTPRTSPSEPVWTPAPRPAEPLAPAEQVQPAAASSSATGAGSWSVVSSA